jgi:hypothetical protein
MPTMIVTATRVAVAIASHLGFSQMARFLVGEATPTHSEARIGARRSDASGASLEQQGEELERDAMWQEAALSELLRRDAPELLRVAI